MAKTTRKSALPILASLVLVGCGVLFTEVRTPVRAAPANAQLEPGPPGDLLYLAIQGAAIPERMRDGREFEGKGPNPYARMLVDGREILRTKVRTAQHTPDFSQDKAGNYVVPRRSNVTLELWSSEVLADQLLCHHKLPDIHFTASSVGSVTIVCTSGARVTLIAEPARPSIGLGLRYRVKEAEIEILEVEPYSPAARVGLAPGDRIVKVGGKAVRALAPGAAKSMINANRATGIELEVEGKRGKRTLTLEEGALYLTERRVGG